MKSLKVVTRKRAGHAIYNNNSHMKTPCHCTTNVFHHKFRSIQGTNVISSHQSQEKKITHVIINWWLSQTLFLSRSLQYRTNFPSSSFPSNEDAYTWMHSFTLFASKVEIAESKLRRVLVISELNRLIFKSNSCSVSRYLATRRFARERSS